MTGLRLLLLLLLLVHPATLGRLDAAELLVVDVLLISGLVVREGKPGETA